MAPPSHEPADPHTPMSAADFDAIVALAADDDEASAIVQSAEARDGLVADALIAAYDLREYWREAQFERERGKEPIRRASKVGRNDSCPCGHGGNKKHKLCHGRER